MEPNHIRQGMPVYDSTGVWLGNVEVRGIGRFLVRTGYFVKQRVVVDDDAVDSIHGASIRLNLSQDQLLERHARSADAPSVAVAPTGEEGEPEQKPNGVSRS